MHLDGCFGFTEGCPREKGQTQVDGGRIKGIGGLVEFYTEIIVFIKTSCLMNQNMTEVSVNSPISILIGIGKGTAGYITTYAQMVKLFMH
mgnify:CR=1 FL=1